MMRHTPIAFLGNSGGAHFAKQNCGVNVGGSYDRGGMSSPLALRLYNGVDRGEGEVERGVLFQNQEAVFVYC